MLRCAAGMHCSLNSGYVRCGETQVGVRREKKRESAAVVRLEQAWHEEREEKSGEAVWTFTTLAAAWTTAKRA